VSHDPSGRTIAEQAYDAGAVATVEAEQVFDVTLRAVVVGSRVNAEGVGAMLELEAETRDHVTGTELTVSERAA
jgi:hypothetical protein